MFLGLKITGKVIALLLGTCLFFAAGSGWAAETGEKEAVAAAELWLALVDQGKYEESWDSAAQLVKDRVSKADWIAAVRGARTTFGPLVKRKLAAKQAETTLPGAPDGDYVVIQYMTSFVKKKEAVETVTPMLEADGKWRVSGYFIK